MVNLTFEEQGDFERYQSVFALNNTMYFVTFYPSDTDDKKSSALYTLNIFKDSPAGNIILSEQIPYRQFIDLNYWDKILKQYGNDDKLECLTFI